MFFFFAMSQSQPINKNKLKVWKLSKIVDSMERLQCFPLWPIYIGEKGRTLGKTYGIKVRCYWEHPRGTHWKPREHIGNLMRIHWELEENMLEMKEKRKKNQGTLSECIGCMKFLCFKTVRHYFWPGLIPPIINLGVLILLNIKNMIRFYHFH